MLEIKWQLHITDAESSSNSSHKLYHSMKCIISILENRVPDENIFLQLGKCSETPPDVFMFSQAILYTHIMYHSANI